MIPPSLQASKWSSIQVLLSANEMEQLLKYLGKFSIFQTALCEKPEITQKQFFDSYLAYCNELECGKLPSSPYYRPFFSSFWSRDSSAQLIVKVGEQFLCRAVRPVIQLQYHLMGFSSVESKFRPMVLGKDSIPWGIQYSYPQLFQDPETQQIVKVDDGFANTSLFKLMRSWIRKFTIPTPFVVNDKRINTPMRIGPRAKKWINSHPSFEQYGIKVLEVL